MKIHVAKIGRVAFPELTAMAERYQERLAPFARVENLDFKDDDAFLKFARGIGPGARLTLLDERGTEFRSVEFAERLRGWEDDPGIKQLFLIVAGPMGPAAEIRALAREKLSLSRVTLTSDMAWMLLWEQLYRAFSILKGTGYHHD